MKPFRSLIITAAMAALTILLVDLSLQKIVPSINLREFDDGIEDLSNSDPSTLVLGSSHGRTFHALGKFLKEKLNSDNELVAIPLEAGQIKSMAWSLENRIAPLVDQRDADGQIVRSKLKRFIFVPTWWDSCEHNNGVPSNIPGRAWAFDHYLTHVIENGINDFNRRYVKYRFSKILPSSRLINERSDPRIRTALAQVLKKPTEMHLRTAYEARIAKWQKDIEEGVKCIGAPEQMSGLNRIIDFARLRKMEMIIVLFPLKPATVTRRGKETTLNAFNKMIEAVAAPLGVKVIDLTWKTPLKDDDFMDDFDHLNDSGNQKFAVWALRNDLSFLIDAPSLIGTVTGKVQD